MNANAWVSVIAMTGWLVLALSSYRAHQVGAGRTTVMVLAWIAIFLLDAGVFVMLGA